MQASLEPAPQIEDALKLCRKSLVAVGVFSLFINILMLTPMFYMINVFDKAVGTGSIPTLTSLAILAVFLYIVLALLEWVRARVMIHISSRIDALLASRIYQLCFQSESGSLPSLQVGSQPISDLNSLRLFVTTPTFAVIFDLPWIPIFLIIMVLFHPALAAVALICIAVMTVVAILNQRSTTRGLKEASKQASAIAATTQRNLRNAEAAAAMGMMSGLSARWRHAQDEMLAVQASTSIKASGYTSLIKTLTVFMQSVAITTGAVLAISQQISPGVMIGAALLLGKTLQPIQQAVSGWRSFVEAKEQYSRLDGLLKEFSGQRDKMPLPPITGHLTAHGAYVLPPGGKNPTLSDINFSLPAGAVTVIMGPSAAGKSTLIRGLLGLWPTVQGAIRIDSAEAASFDRDELGSQVGYLPQSIELFEGTVAENIARFGTVDPEAVVDAAKNAFCHRMILALPEGYDTVISGTKGALSPGQRQRIALARAVYRRPKLIVLDEPNSNLDEVGEGALHDSIAKMKSFGSSIVIVSHRQRVLGYADIVILMESGRIKMYGPPDSIVSSLEQVKPMIDNSTGSRRSKMQGP